jgi:hypothetical protein
MLLVHWFIGSLVYWFSAAVRAARLYHCLMIWREIV